MPCRRASAGAYYGRYPVFRLRAPGSPATGGARTNHRAKLVAGMIAVAGIDRVADGGLACRPDSGLLFDSGR